MNEENENLTGLYLIEIKPLGDFELWVKFNTLEQKKINIKPLIDEFELKKFDDPMFFYTANITEIGVSWEQELRITTEYLYLNGYISKI